MCGICGELRFDGAPVSREALVTMRDALIHRGPDSEGAYLSPGGAAGLGFRRLAIVDLSRNGHQPMGNEDGAVQVVFNGEIYNFAAIREELLQKGHVFRSRTDSEVIVHLYEELGPACIDRLDGMFAIGIWDQRAERLTLARDRTGKKPLFYTRDHRRLLFASEIKAFFRAPDTPLAIDREMVPYYFLYGYVPSPRTLYHGVEQVDPGTVVTIDRSGRSTSRRFWTLTFPSAAEQRRNGRDHQSAIAGVRTLMTAAVKRRLVADVPLGAFLSGGVDSTVVVGLMSQLLDRPVKTFSIGFKDSPEYDETSYARLVADRFKTDHTEFVVEPGAFDLIETLVWHHDGPFGDSSAVPTYIVSALTRKHVTVVLNGDGGDELFAGYLRFFAAVVAEQIPASIRNGLKGISGLLPAGPTARHTRSRVKRFASAMSLPLDERITRWSGLFYDDLEQLLAPELTASVAPIDRLRSLRRSQRSATPGMSTLSRLLLVNFDTYLLDDLLVKVDRCTMANSLEARSPFLDTALIEYVAGLPDRMKLARGRTKIILREAFADLIPEQIQRRGKMGFGIPFGQWFRGALRQQMDDLLLASDARYVEYLSRDYVRALVRRHHAGAADLGLQLWTILTFEIWLRALPAWTRSADVVATGAG
jgi:asparagine synthase (glutamine-hydrolysing)